MGGLLDAQAALAAPLTYPLPIPAYPLRIHFPNAAGSNSLYCLCMGCFQVLQTSALPLGYVATRFFIISYQALDTID
jgi:hypothetical protein